MSLSVFSLFLLISVAVANDHGMIRRRMPESQPQAAAEGQGEPLFAALKDVATEVEEASHKIRRKFVSYTPSSWEILWLDNVDKWAEEKTICDELLNHQQRYIRDFLSLMCSSRLEAPYQAWCFIDDELQPLWFNSDTNAMSWTRPSFIPDDIGFPPPEAVIPGPEHEHIMSKFVFYDELRDETYVEYIEPLVSHLRFPLAKCLDAPEEAYRYHDTTFRGWLLPPPPVLRGDKAIYFDAGASTWDDKRSGGPSLKFFTNMWKRYGVNFDDVYAFEKATTEADFYGDLPSGLHRKIHYKQRTVASNIDDDSPDTPFLPKMIDENFTKNDYVLFKVDIDSPQVEAGMIDYILDNDTNVDELVWEHHVCGNYLMEEHWGQGSSPLTLRQSYDYFLKLRRKGIRAHSWV